VDGVHPPNNVSLMMASLGRQFNVQILGHQLVSRVAMIFPVIVVIVYRTKTADGVIPRFA